MEAKGADEYELISLKALIPFDDRICRGANYLRMSWIRSFLKDVKIGLYTNAASMSLVDLARSMNIINGPDEDVKRKNVGLLFF